MIKLDDFIKMGYSIKSEGNHPEIRVLHENDEDYEKIQKMAVELNDYSKINEALKEFPRRYFLRFVSCACNKVVGATVNYDDPNARTAVLEKGESMIIITRDVMTGRVYEVRDSVRCFGTGWDFSMLCDSNTDLGKTVERIREHREKRRRDIINHYNQEIKNLKRDYREMLSSIKEQIKDLGEAEK